MKSSPPLSTIEAPPLYVRWNPDRSLYALELRLDIVSRVSGELAQAEILGIEIGGMLLGSLPTPESPTLRIEEVAIVSRRFEDGAIYILDPGQQNRFSEIREAARLKDRVPVGFFRSHLRPGPLQPSLADKTLLAGEFGQGLYTLLMIQSREPRTAAFFLAANGELPDQPSARKFFFDDSEFKFLPEVAGEELDAKSVRSYPARAPLSRFTVLAGTAFALLVSLLTLGAFAGDVSRWFRPASNKLDLAVSEKLGVLRISWDHNAPLVKQAKGAVVTITDGPSRRDIRLGPDELKSGEVDYEYLTGRTFISLALDAPGSGLPPQTFDWTSSNSSQ